MEEVVYDRLHETAYGESPLARTILGPVENIRCGAEEQIYWVPWRILGVVGDAKLKGVFSGFYHSPVIFISICLFL